MSAVETWYCDWHEAEESSDYVNEDEARDRGWIKVEHKEPLLTKRWTHWVAYHVCPQCQADAEVQQALREGDFRDENLDPIKVGISG